MLLESFIYFSNSFRCPPYVRKFGLLEELIAIDARYKRNKSAWQEHLKRTKSIILSEAKKLNQKEKILILGAGSLNDVPLAEVSAIFSEVHLVDIFFLNSTLKKVKAYGNVKVHELDLTESLEQLYDDYSKSNPKEPFMFSDPKAPEKFLNLKFDMVVSLNLLSQLPLAAKKFFDKKNMISDHLDSFYELLIVNHLVYLQNFAKYGSKVLLITDVEKEIFEEGLPICCENTLQDLDISKYFAASIDSWTWNLAPRGELGAGFELCLKIKCGII